MPIFYYKAAQPNGTIIEGELEAPQKKIVIETLERQGLLPLAVELKEKGIVQTVKRGFGLYLFQGITTLDKIVLVRHLSTMIKAGMGLLEAVEILMEDATKPLMKKILSQAKFNLEKGIPLSATFAAYPKYFPPVIVNLLKAGEASGNLERVLDQISEQLQKEYDLIRKVRNAMAYPIILLVASFGVVILLLVFVLPRLAKIFSQTGIKLPLITRILVAISKVLTYNIFLTLGVIILLVIFIFALRKFPKTKKILASLYNRTPILKDLIKKIALTRFCRVLNTLLVSGIPIMDALQITALAVSNEIYKEAILKTVEKDIAKGISLGKSLSQNPEIFPRLVTSMISIGEKAGSLEMVLRALSNFYEEEVDSTLRNLVSILEPILLLFVGFIVGSVALSIILPVYQVLGTVR